MKHFINREMLALNVMTFPVDPAIVGEFADVGGSDDNFARIAPGKKWCSDIQWISAANEATFDRFQSAFDRLGIADHCAQYLDLERAVRLYAGFIIVRSRCTDAYFHVDWARTNNEAFTFMTPITASSEDFGLLYKRLDDSIGQYDYQPGQGIAFGENFAHATKPAQSDEPVSLLCFEYGADKMEHWPNILSTVGDQVTHLKQPDGEFVCAPAISPARRY